MARPGQGSSRRSMRPVAQRPSDCVRHVEVGQNVVEAGQHCLATCCSAESTPRSEPSSTLLSHVVIALQNGIVPFSDDALRAQQISVTKLKG